MTDAKRLLEQRTKIKKKKPVFVRNDITKKKKLSKSWRRPKGLHNKQRIKGKNHGGSPESGFRSPKSIRFFHKSGLNPVLVSNIKQLDKITKEQGIIISSSIGARKKLLLLNEIKKRNLVLLSMDVEKALLKIDAQIKHSKEERKKKLERRTKKKKAVDKAPKPEEKKKEEQKQEKEEVSEEEKKKLEKQEKDKLLIKKS